MMMWNGFEGMGWGWFGFLPMVLLWVLVIVGIVVLVKWLVGAETPRSRGNALDVLRERYARGDLTREEFERMKREIAS